ncbi:MAG: hypothetical protein R3B90_07465 [Planctomycetaceae bacterium]
MIAITTSSSVEREAAIWLTQLADAHRTISFKRTVKEEQNLTDDLWRIAICELQPDPARSVNERRDGSEHF